MIAIIGGLGAAICWALATVASSRSSRMIGSRVVLAWIMIVGTIVGLPLAVASGVPTDIPPEAPLLLLVGGLAYSGGLYVAYRALVIGKVSIVAPIVATEGALAAVIAVILGDPLGVQAGLILAVIAAGVVLAAIEPARPDVPVADIELAADALEGPPDPSRPTPGPSTERPREAVVLSIIAAGIFAVGLVASGKAAVLVPPIWVAVTARLIGLVVVAAPLLIQRRLILTRIAAPLVILSGVGEIAGSTLSAWGATDSIAIVAVLGSQFAAIAAVLAFLLFGERLSRSQVAGVALIIVGVTVLAAFSV